MDDFTLSGSVNVVASDVENITCAASETCLLLNLTMCEIIPFDDILTEKNRNLFISSRQTLLGAPVLKGPAIDHALITKSDNLTKFQWRDVITSSPLCAKPSS